MDYRYSVAIPGNPAKALENTRDVFVRNGFRLTETNEHGFQVTGPGMRSTSQDSLRGVSRATITLSSKELTIEADLGGARGMQRFVLFFPPTLILGLMAFFAITHTGSFQTIAFSSLLQLAVWLPISLIWAPFIRKSTVKAIEVMMDNAAMISKG